MGAGDSTRDDVRAGHPGLAFIEVNEKAPFFSLPRPQMLEEESATAGGHKLEARHAL